MPSVNVIDLNNATVGSIELADAVFGAEVNEALLYEAVKQYTAAQRSGTAFELQDHKTKNLSTVFGQLDAKKSILLVESGNNVNLTRASRNLKSVKLVPTKDVNVYDLLKYQEVLLTEPAARKLSEALAK